MHPETLRRIGEDLDQERRAREWLRGARQSARERRQVRGLQGRGTRYTNISRLDDAREEITALGIEPRLMLRPTNSSNVLWEVSLDIPDLSHLLLRFPKIRPILTGSRCVVAGASGRPLARGRCLHGTQRVRLTQWPRADDVLLHSSTTSFVRNVFSARASSGFSGSLPTDSPTSAGAYKSGRGNSTSWSAPNLSGQMVTLAP